jgi:AcrR family transcriptional regulator
LAIIVDKEQKKRDIACSCKKLFAEHAFKDITISQIAKTAGIAKGSLYDYFKNKEDVVFELVHILVERHNAQKEEALAHADSIEEKVKIFFRFFYEEESADLRKLYKEFIAISLTNPSEEIIAFQSNYFHYYSEWFERIIEEAVQKGELKPVASEMVLGIFTAIEGIFITSCRTDVIDDVEQEIDRYLKIVFELIKERR